MDRIEFTNSLNCSDFVDMSVFSEFMACYDLISCYDMLKVDNYEIIDQNKILFNISIIPSSGASIQEIKKTIDSTIIDKYSYKFQMQSNIIDKDKLNIILYKTRVSG